MGCNRYCTQADLDHIIASADIEDPGDVDKEILAEAIDNFGDAVADFMAEYGSSAEYADAILDTLNQVAGIEGMDSVLQDLIHGGTKATGAEFQLAYCLHHANDIAAVGVPFAHQAKDGHWYGREGMDVINSDGSVAELKSFNYSSPYYLNHAEQVAAECGCPGHEPFGRSCTQCGYRIRGLEWIDAILVRKCAERGHPGPRGHQGIGSTQIEWRVE